MATSFRQRCAVLVATLFLLVVTSPAFAQAQTIRITRCDEPALDAALAQARDGDQIAIACSGTIRITSTKVLSANVTLSGVGQNVILDGGRSTRVFFIPRHAIVTLEHLTIQHASAESGGSAINTLGTLTLSHSTLRENVHALANFGSLTVRQTVIADNSGAGIYNSGTMTVQGSTFAGNRHGIDNASGTALVVNSTFTGNTAPGRSSIGAGIANSGTVTVLNSTFSENTAGAGGAIGTHRGGTVTVANTLLVGSAVSSACFGPITDGGHNLQFPGASCGDTIATVDPLLMQADDPADGGNPFHLFIPDADSPALDAGDAAVCASAEVGSVDQRGILRITDNDTACDIGAVEHDDSGVYPFPFSLGKLNPV